MQMKVESKIAIESELDDICNSLLNVNPIIQHIVMPVRIGVKK
jgi:phosphoribosylformylglycinamidine (FGAM) synthase PurS component